MPRPRSVAVLAALAGAVLASPLAAQLRDELREQEYAEIAEEVAAIERQGNLLKRVIRLVKPTVVHIDVQKRRSIPRLSDDPIEEAGSGVIIELAGGNYVLTNRHACGPTEAPTWP